MTLDYRAAVECLVQVVMVAPKLIQVGEVQGVKERRAVESP